MRRLAEEADVERPHDLQPVRLEDGVPTVLVYESFDAADAAIDEIDAVDPIERIWEAVTISVASNCRYVPKAVVAAVVADPRLHSELARRWRGPGPDPRGHAGGHSLSSAPR